MNWLWWQFPLSAVLPLNFTHLLLLLIKRGLRTHQTLFFVFVIRFILQFCRRNVVLTLLLRLDRFTNSIRLFL